MTWRSVFRGLGVGLVLLAPVRGLADYPSINSGSGPGTGTGTAFAGNGPGGLTGTGTESGFGGGTTGTGMESGATSPNFPNRPLGWIPYLWTGEYRCSPAISAGGSLALTHPAGNVANPYLADDRWDFDLSFLTPSGKPAGTGYVIRCAYGACNDRRGPGGSAICVVRIASSHEFWLRDLRIANAPVHFCTYVREARQPGAARSF